MLTCNISGCFPLGLSEPVNCLFRAEIYLKMWYGKVRACQEKGTATGLVTGFNLPILRAWVLFKGAARWWMSPSLLQFSSFALQRWSSSAAQLRRGEAGRGHSTSLPPLCFPLPHALLLPLFCHFLLSEPPPTLGRNDLEQFRGGSLPMGFCLYLNSHGG